MLQAQPSDGSALPCEHIPRITKLLALAIKFDRMLQGRVKNRGAGADGKGFAGTIDSDHET
jgi:hypothetical protein